jgi:hypothetical protein
MSGDYAVAGLYTDATNGPRSGAALVFRRDAQTGVWVQMQRLIPADNQEGDFFGSRVAMYGDRLAIAARSDDDVASGAGSVYLYRRSEASGLYALEQKVLPPPGTVDMGGALSLWDDLLVTGGGGFSDYDAHVFRRTDQGWIREATLSNDAPGAEYAFAVGTDGDTIMIGGRVSIGAERFEWVDVFDLEPETHEWVKTQVLTHPEDPTWQFFGLTLAMDRGRAVIGSYRADAAVPFGHWGGAYVFSKAGGFGAWSLEARLDTTPGLASQWRWLDIEDDTAVIGVTTPLPKGQHHGFISVFRREQGSGQWMALGNMQASTNPVRSNRYGFTVVIDADRVIVGAPDYDYDAPSGTVFGPGSIHFLDLSREDCNENAICDDIDIAIGTSLDRNGNGIPDECETVGDVTGDGLVNADDLIAVILAWGPCPVLPPPPAQSCPADIAPPGGDGLVDAADLVLVVLNWTL